MSGIIRFIFAIIWFAIGLNSIGLLGNITKIMSGMAVESQHASGIKFGQWNRILNTDKAFIKSSRGMEK